MKPANVLFTFFVLLLVLGVGVWRMQFEYKKREALNRQVKEWVLTKSAAASLQCIHRSTADVQQVVATGIILYHRSQLRLTCPVYAVQGTDRQQTTMTVVLQQCKGQTVVLQCSLLHGPAPCAE